MRSTSLQISKALLVLPLILSLACSNDDSKDGGKKPENKPKQKITGAAANALTGQAAIFDAGRGLGGANMQGTSMRIASDSIPGGDSRRIVQSKEQIMERTISEAIRDGKCNISTPDQPRNPGNGEVMPEFPEVEVGLTGVRCPMNLSLKIKLVGDGNSTQFCQETATSIDCKFKAGGELTYSIQDQDLQEKMGVTSGFLKMEFDMAQRKKKDSRTAQFSAMSIKGTLKVKITALDLENVTHSIIGQRNFAIEGDLSRPSVPRRGPPSEMPETQVTANEDLSYSNSRNSGGVVLKSSIAVKGQAVKETYTIDGQIVTAEVYQLERQKFSNSMMDIGSGGESSGGNGNPPSESNPTDPNFPSEPPIDEPPVTQPPPVTRPPTTPPTRPAPPVIEDPIQPPSALGYTCLFKNSSSNTLHLGEGSVVEMAKSFAKQSCQRGRYSSSCVQVSECEAIESAEANWFCESTNSSFDRNYSGTGRNAMEAGYLAFQECVADTGSASKCLTVSRRSCTPFL